MGTQHHLACRALLRHEQRHDLGTPTLLQTTAKAYTIWANNSGGSSLVTVTITINDVAPGSFEYEPENNTLTNNTGVHLAPQFINRTTGNGSTWSVTNLQAAQGTSSLGHYMDILVGDTIYFSANDGTTGTELWAHDTSNHSTWQVADINNWITMGGLRLSSNPGEYMAVSVGDTIYFSAKVEQQGTELWAHNSTNGTTWRVADIRSGSAGDNPGQWLNILVGDVLYFSADDGSEGSELWAHNTSNVSTWQVADIRSGSVGSNPGQEMGVLVGDVIYFDANDGSTGNELWAHNTSSGTTWRVTDINSGPYHSYTGAWGGSILVGDTLYFDAQNRNDNSELWAHDTSNGTSWLVADLNSNYPGSRPGQYSGFVLAGDTIYFDAGDGISGSELYAHDTSNRSTWLVENINPNSALGGVWSGSFPGQNMKPILVGETLYFTADDDSTGHELWAHDTSNGTTWQGC